MANDGGRAFPLLTRTEYPFDYNDGMSLRDYFAAKALVGLLAADSTRAGTVTRDALVAKACYQIADALLAEKDKVGG